MQQKKFLQNRKVARRRHPFFFCVDCHSIFFHRSRKVQELWISSTSVMIPVLTASEFLIPPKELLSQDLAINRFLPIAPTLLQADTVGVIKTTSRLTCLVIFIKIILLKTINSCPVVA